MEDSADGYQPLCQASEGIEVEASSFQEPGSSGDARPHDEFHGTWEWKVNNFTTASDKIYSDKFEIGTYIWRILMWPRGRKERSPDLAVYLDASEAQYTPLHMSPKAVFTLTLVNHLDPASNVNREAPHTFTPTESDWGFVSFHSLDAILNPRNGFLDGDSITIRVEIQVQKDERFAYDSRKETGHGATCYMNSLLQYLYHIAYFRKAVYHMPTLESDEASKNLPMGLQSVFYKLQYSKTCVSTKDLTKSFGWGTYDAFMQHDVQELNRGHTYSFIECLNVEYKSTRKESFMDLQLDVKGCKNIYDSLIKYCEVEIMDGPNQYKAEGHGMHVKDARKGVLFASFPPVLQDARKGVLFESFPPVLQVQLKRFDYDFQRDAMVKINNRYEFFETLDLDFENGACLSPNCDRSVRNMYRLHSVLVHSGGVHGGHYYAFIRPDGKQWFKFDDDRVTIADKEKAMDEQFGMDDDLPLRSGYNMHSMKEAKCSNAYMLVYVRESDWDRIMCPVTKDDIQEHLKDRLEQEQLEKEMRQKEKQEAHLFCTLKVF
eukprot:gene22134-29196_t